MRLAPPLAVLALAAGLLLGCGASGSQESGKGGGAQPGAGTPTAPPGSSTRHCRAGEPGVVGLAASGTSCTEARHLMLGWVHSGACRPPAGTSRSGCPALSYRCLATATDRGWAVSCSKPGRSVAFTARRG
jgi:hypothetical protein